MERSYVLSARDCYRMLEGPCFLGGHSRGLLKSLPPGYPYQFSGARSLLLQRLLLCTMSCSMSSSRLIARMHWKAWKGWLVADEPRLSLPLDLESSAYLSHGRVAGMAMLRRHYLIIIPYTSVIIWILSPILQPLQISVDRNIGVNIRLYLGDILLPGKE